MKWSFSIAHWIPVLAAALLFGSAVHAQEFPSFDPDYPPPPDWSGPVFSLSQSYPQTPPPPEEQPWHEIDVKTDGFKYLRAVLDYAIEGNAEVNWDVASNPVRTWYHAPWMHSGCGGREFARGLTRERTSRPHELHPNQDGFVDNWAVGIYNAPGGFTLGQVWKDHSAPDPSAADFPEGTVGIKLLFTAATTTEVPYLANDLVWQANVYPDTGSNPCRKPVSERPRVMRDLSLLQVDVAVRDSQSEETGWVFGTFIYDAAAEGETVYDRLVPVGVMWGNDPSVLEEFQQDGAFVNAALQESVVNPDLIQSGTWPDNRAFVTHFGLGGRVNGPVDNKISSCMSCHGLAAAPTQAVVPSGVTDPDEYTESDFDHFFANIEPGPINTGAFTRLDYSLQLAFGIRNHATCVSKPEGEGCGPVPELSGTPPKAEKAMALAAGVEISRDGSPAAAEWPAPAADAAERGAPSGGMSSWMWIAVGVAIFCVLLVLLLRRS